MLNTNQNHRRRFAGTCLSALLCIALLGSHWGGRAMAQSGAAISALTTRDLRAHGSPSMYWIARTEQENPVGNPAALSPGSSTPARTLIQARTVDPPGPWTLIARINARVDSLADRGSQLAVLLDNGDWMLVWDGGSSSGSQPTDGVRLVQLASGPDGELFAIASARLGSVSPTTAGSTQPAATMPSGVRLLYRLKSSGWEMVAPLPDETLHGDLSLEVFPGNRATIAVLADGIIRTWSWNAASSHWESMGQIPTDSSVTRVKLLGNLPAARLWAGSDTGAGRLYALRDNAWTSGAALALTGSSVPETSPRDVTVAGGTIRLVVAAEKSLHEFSFAPDGSPAGDAPLAPIRMLPVRYDWAGAMMVGVVVLLLCNMLLRREPAEKGSLEAIATRIAPLGRRLLAGLIDLLPVVGTTLMLAHRLLVADSTESTTPDEMLLRSAGGIYLAVTVYILYTLVAESLWGWTIGKRLLKLRVVMVDGSPPTAGAIALRNFLRVFDLLTFVMILFTPLRQRLGDLAGDTVVVLEDAKPHEEEAGTTEEPASRKKD